MQLIVLGMHRSGTSAIARTLNLLGCYFGSEEVSTGVASDNPKGFWERKDVVEINDFILSAAGGSWWDVENLDFSAISSEDLDYINKRIGDTVLKLDAHRPWFIKDPRLCLTLNFWLPYLERPMFIYAIRFPVQVARSLQKRNDMPIDYGLLLWEFYIRSLLHSMQKRQVIPVLYEKLVQEPFTASMILYKSLIEAGVTGIRPPDRSDIEAFVDHTLNHFKTGEEQPLLSSEQQSLFSLFCEGAPKSMSMDERIQLLNVLGKIKNENNWAKKMAHPANDETIFISSADLKSITAKLENLSSELSELRNISVELENIKSELKTSSKDIDIIKTELESRNAKLESRNAKLESRNADLNSCLQNIFRSRSLKYITIVYHIFGFGRRGLSAERNRIKSLLNNDNSELIDHSLKLEHAGRGKMLLRFFRLAISKPLLTLKLLHPRRIKNAIVFLTCNKGNLQQLFKRYQEIYGTIPIEGITKQYEELITRASFQRGKGDIFIFPVIDWSFRHQRPQHLALQLGLLGYRVFYFSTTPLIGSKAPFKIIENPGENVFVCKLNAKSNKIENIYQEKMSNYVRNSYQKSLLELMETIGIKNSISLLNHPYWKHLADVIPGTVIGYDCMDHHAGFYENTSEIPEIEKELISDADFVVTSSLYLHENIGRLKPNVIIRNGCEYNLFVTEGQQFPSDGRLIAGYIGAIADWFDIDLIVYAAKHLPNWRFVLVGSTAGCKIESAKRIKNIEFIGEVEYSRVPFFLRGFDVCLIPFKITELTKATNPVKIYEYLSAGKPVVSTALPEVKLLADKIFLAHTPEEFVEQLQLAYSKKDDAKIVDMWRRWASEQDWSLRAVELEKTMILAQPLVSIIILTYNNIEFTKACLESVEKFTFYPNYEVILVDNASSDGSREYMEGYVRDRDNWQLIVNESNIGFAAGNNVGISKARGEYVILLNNDTYVTPGWLKNLIRPFVSHKDLGLTGPVTNNIGNEAKINIAYSNMEEMIEKAIRYTTNNARKLFYVNTIAFFCVAISREIIGKVGFLDEQFKLGFFEDDDYCRRVKQLGYDIAIVEDSFVHHHLSASFDKLENERRQQLFEENKNRFEAKWGEWQAHSYR